VIERALGRFDPCAARSDAVTARRGAAPVVS
jgi:hypothetical protein